MVRFLLLVVFMFVLVSPARGQVTAVQADFDGSGVVDFADFLQFVSVFGSATGDDNFQAKFDFDGSGKVDFADFLQFINVFGQTVPDTDSIEGDRAALVALYNATGGDNWTNNTNWLSDKPLWEWYGVGITVQGRVAMLQLGGNQLSGSIPPELGNLSNLAWLSLNGNQLSGSIPESLGSLTNLEYLNLQRNQLSGLIPSSLGSLTNLTSLSFYGNQLSGSIPPELGNLSKLESLSLDSNQLSGSIPPELGNLSNLEKLGLGSNQLSGPIPESLGNLPHLQHFVVGENSNLCMPASLKKWKFYFYCQGRYGIVSKCDGGSVEGDRAALVALYNATDGANWTKKTNWLSDKPLGEWHGVETVGEGAVGRYTQGRVFMLQLEHNQLSSSIPPELGDLAYLWYLNLGVNQLSGSIPESLGNLIDLDILDLQGNHLTGSIPESLGNLTNLGALSLGGNQLSGSIPPALGNLTNLRSLTLHFNHLSGSIPPELGNLSKLKTLWLRANQLTGFVPLTFQNLTNLEDFVYAPFVCMPDDAGMQQWGAKAVKRQLLDECLSPVVESWPPKADLIRQLENLGWFSVRFENTDDFDHLQIYATFEAVQKWNKAIVGFPSHVSVPMKLSVKRSYEGPGPIADASITFYPASEGLDFFFFRDVMIHEIGHNLGISGHSDSLYTKTANPDGQITDLQHQRFIFNGTHANLKYKELIGNRAFENELITDGMGHWKGRFLFYDVMASVSSAVLSAITLSALVDMGYKIDMTKANKLHYELLPSATKPTLFSTPMLPHTWCGGIAHSHVSHSQ